MKHTPPGIIPHAPPIGVDSPLTCAGALVTPGVQAAECGDEPASTASGLVDGPAVATRMACHWHDAPSSTDGYLADRSAEPTGADRHRPDAEGAARADEPGSISPSSTNGPVVPSDADCRSLDAEGTAGGVFPIPGYRNTIT